MKKKDISDALGMIGDDLITGAHEITPKTNRGGVKLRKLTTVLIAAAVCLAVVAGSFTVGAAMKKATRSDYSREKLVSLETFDEYLAYMKEHDKETELSKAIQGKRFRIGDLSGIIGQYPNMKLNDLPEKPLFVLSDRHQTYRNEGTLLYNDIQSLNGVGFNTNYIQKLDDDHVAVIYRFYDDENLSDENAHYAALVYARYFMYNNPDGVLYTISSEKYNSSDEYADLVIDDREEWLCNSEMYIIDEIHLSDEYNGIKAGDKMSALYEIDPSFRFDVRRHFLTPETEAAVNEINEALVSTDEEITPDYSGIDAECLIYKALSDGVLEVEFQFNLTEPVTARSYEGDPDRIITNIEFHPYSEGVFSEYVSLRNNNILNFLK